MRVKYYLKLQLIFLILVIIDIFESYDDVFWLFVLYFTFDIFYVLVLYFILVVTL